MRLCAFYRLPPWVVREWTPEQLAEAEEVVNEADAENAQLIARIQANSKGFFPLPVIVANHR